MKRKKQTKTEQANCPGQSAKKSRHCANSKETTLYKQAHQNPT